MPDMCRAYDAYEAYEVWKGLFLTPSTAGNSFHRLRAVPLPRGGRSWGFAGQGLRPFRRLHIGALRSPLSPFAPSQRYFSIPRTSPQRPPSSREGDRPQAVEGVFSRRKAYSFPKLKYMRQNAEPCACFRRILLNFIFNSARSVNVPAFFGREHPPRTQEI